VRFVPDFFFFSGSNSLCQEPPVIPLLSVPRTTASHLSYGAFPFTTCACDRPSIFSLRPMFPVCIPEVPESPIVQAAEFRQDVEPAVL
jgi:hypothetical protein